MNKPTRWSYSSISTWKQCHLKWKYSYIDGIEWPSSAAMSRGTRMHLMAEEFVNGTVQVVPSEIKNMGPTLLSLKGMGAKAEEVWLLDDKWNPVQDQSKAWIKAIIDVHYVLDDVLYVKDYKSGRMYPDHLNQLELYGLIGLKTFPEVKRVETSAIYMDLAHEGSQGSIIPQMLPKMIEPWDTEAKAMMGAESYEPTVSAACAWCPYSKRKGGPCEFG